MSTVYLIPSLLDEDGLPSIPAYIPAAIKSCEIFFVENDRTTRRYFKKLWPEMVIDNYEWCVIDPAAANLFTQKIKEGRTIGIVSEAGCPGIADPGQELVAIAQQAGVVLKPLVGPNAILLALMASGLNGQRFQFLGYLPIENQQRQKAIRDLESESAKKDCTQIFIETPYRNNQIFEALLNYCGKSTQLCVAVDLTGKNEWIKTRSIANWQQVKPDLHKRPAIFLVYAGQ